MLNAYLLICDLHASENISYFAQSYKNNSLKSDYLSKLMSTYVPPDLEVLINNLAPTYDPQRRLQLYVPSLAAYDFLTDYGRSVPPSMFILAHHLLASSRTNAEPETILRTFYATTILEVGNTHFTPANFIGGYFDRLQRPTAHANWLNSRFEKIFNPVISRALIQRPTLAKTRLQSQHYNNAESVNPYEFLLCYSETNIEKILEIINDVSSFLKSESKATKVLSQTLENSTGINIMYHSIWTVTLPTFHTLPPPTVTAVQDSDEINDVAYARYIKFLQPAPEFKSKLPPPTADIEPALYLVGKEPYNPQQAPFSYEEFDKQRHVYPDVLWFQPYSKNPSAINFSLTLGLFIESADIDSVSIPIPNIWMSLTENNSMYLQGTLPIEHVLKFSPNSELNNRFRLCSRELNADKDQPIGMSFRDSSKVMVPRFGIEHVRANINQLHGVHIQNNCNDPEIDFTYTAWRASELPNVPLAYAHLWSSYRYVSQANSRNRRVHLYYTLRQYYGESVTLSRTRNPVLLLPS